MFVTDGVVGNTNSWRSSGPSPHWAVITLPAPVTLGSAQLFLGSDDTGATANFSLQHFTNGAWSDIPGASFNGNTATVLNVIFNSPVTTAQVRFHSTDATVTVREVALYATNNTPGLPIGTDVTLNLAKQRIVTASSVAGANFARLAVDGYGGPDAGGWHSANASGPHTLEVTLPVATRIGSAHVYSGNATVDAISAFTLQYWTGSAWATIPGGNVANNTQKELSVGFSSPVSTTRVRLNIPGSGTQIVRELAVFAAATGISNYPLWTDVVNAPAPLTTWETFGDGFWQLLNRATGNALEAGTGIALQAPPTADASQEFQVLYHYDSDNFRLRHRQNGQCLMAPTDSSALQPSAMKSDFHNVPNELWRLETLDGGYHRMVNAWTGLALQADEAVAGAVTFAPPSADFRQQWQLSFQSHYPKKGTAGHAESWSRFGASWNYIWSRDPNTLLPPQVAFAPMQWNAASIEMLPHYFPGWHGEAKPMTLLGFNEPDLADQANMSVATVVSLWPQLEAANLPLASPAVSWAFTSWLTNFYDQVDELGYRVDYTAVHWYAFPSADGFINHLQNIYNRWGRPLWITEFSSRGSGVWSEEDNYRFLAEFLWRAEDLPWLRRYGVFSFKQDPPAQPWERTSPRSAIFKTDGVTLTACGELYAAWDADRTIRTNTPYLLHNRGSSFRVGNSNTASPAVYNLRTNEPAVHWQWVPAPTPGRYYLQSLSDARRLSWNGTSLILAAPGTTGAIAEWTFTHENNGYFHIDHPATGQRLRMNRGNDANSAPISLTLLMTPAGTVNDNTRWRFIKPGLPVMVTATPSDGNVSLSWTDYPGATQFNVQRADHSGGPYTVIASPGTNHYTDTGLHNGTTYYYVVSATLAGGNSSNSSEVSATPQPRLFAVNSGGGAAPPFAADAGFSGGNTSSTTKGIDFAEVGTAGAPAAVYQSQRHGNFSYTFGSLTPGANYRVRLHFVEYFWTTFGQRVFNVSLNNVPVLANFDIVLAAGSANRAIYRDFVTAPNASGQINLQFSTVTDNAKISGLEIFLAPPNAPTGLAAVTSGNTQITLTWSPSVSATSYSVKRASTSGAPYETIATTPAPGFTDTDLDAGITYYYVVTALNSAGESPNSSQVGALTPPILSIVNSDGSMVLSWPATATGLALHGTYDLSPPIIWSLVPAPATSQDGVWRVVLPVSNTNQFFRLMPE